MGGLGLHLVYLLQLSRARGEPQAGVIPPLGSLRGRFGNRVRWVTWIARSRELALGRCRGKPGIKIIGVGEGGPSCYHLPGPHKGIQTHTLCNPSRETQINIAAISEDQLQHTNQTHQTMVRANSTMPHSILYNNVLRCTREFDPCCAHVCFFFRCVFPPFHAFYRYPIKINVS